MLNLDEEIIIEAFNIYYNRIPNLDRDENKQMIQDLMYYLNYFHIYLYSHANEGVFPNYTLDKNCNLYSKLIDDIIESINSKQYRYPLIYTIRNKDDLKKAKITMYEFLKKHPNLTLHNVVTIDYILNNKIDINKLNIEKQDICYIQDFFNSINERNFRIPKTRKREILWMN